MSSTTAGQPWRRRISWLEKVQPFEARARARWEDLLPPEIALEQAIYERDAAIVRARNAGATLTELSRRIGRSVERVRVIVEQFNQRKNRPTPVERFLSGPPLR